MTLIESFILALALSVDSFVVSATCAFKSKMPLGRGLVMALVFGVFQGLFPLMGALLGGAFRNVASAVDHWIAFGLLLLVGGKMIWDAFHDNAADEQLDVTRFATICLLAVATSIDAFVVGIGFGLNSTHAEMLLTVLIIFLVTFLLSLVGVTLGRRNIPVPDKVATILAGLVLIALGTYTLIDHLTM